MITGGDSGIGRAVATLFAREGPDIAIAYLLEDDDARGNRADRRADGPPRGNRPAGPALPER